MQYQGYFRSTNTEIDEKGQLYKVEIFTDGKLYTSHPYIGNSSVMIPDTPVELTLSGNPFTVSFTNDDENIYKPYKGSSAEVGLILNSFIPDFLNNKKCGIFVRLLKWNNDVIKTTDQYKNTVTGQTLSKTKIQTIIGGTLITVYNDFTPKNEDIFCYTTEWVGYATPNSFNQPYTKAIEEYTMECQDILTSLKYYDYTQNTAGTSTIIESIFQSLDRLPNNPISNIYITNTITIPQSGNQSILEMLSTINDNWCDEDNKWTDCLTVLSNMMNYLNCTMIQWKDSIYITTPDAVAFRRSYYTKHYNWNGYTYSSIPMVLIDGSIDIAHGELGNDETNIGTTSTYKEVSVSTNDYYDDNLSIELTDNNEYLNEVSRWDDIVNYVKVVDVDRNIISVQHPYNYDIEDVTAVYSGSILDYVPDTEKNLPEITRYSYNRDTADEDEEYTVEHHTLISNPTTKNAMFYSVGCTICDIGCTEISSDNAMADSLRSYDGKRVFLFHSTSPQVDAGSGLSISPLQTALTNLTSENQDNHKVITIKTKKTFMKKGQSLQLNGDLMFFQNITLPLQSGWAVDELKAYKAYMYIWMKISIPVNGTTYYLHNDISNGSGSYIWNTTEGWVKIWYDNFAGYDREANKRNRGFTTSFAFETSFSFTKNTRGADGTCIELPEALGDGIYQSITIDIARPYGCGVEKRVPNTSVHLYPCQYATLSDFKVNVIDNNETTYRYTEDTNNEFKSVMSEDAVDDYSVNSLMISSDYRKNTSKASILGLKENLINNTAAGVNSLPEACILYNLIRTYIYSRLKLDITLPYEVSPFTLLKWSTQFPDKKFVVDKMSIDYAYNDYHLSLMDKDLADVIPEIFAENKTRNYRRNGDNLYNPLPRKNRNKITTEFVDTEFVKNFISFTKGNTGTEYVNLSLLRNIVFEPVIENGEMILSTPEYLYNTDTFNCTVQNGEIIINY